ncbi:MAG TPA: alpha/beta fold hydrolase [Verrucomicrobiae bacterium]|nr:alpha/beta fold hydrolase [Verrucomicrobiae bacterium]
MTGMPMPSAGKIAFTETGSGAPLVLLHGWSLSRKVWYAQEPFFARSRRVVTVDLRGHGDSSPAESWSLEEAASDIAALFHRLELRDAALAGWSLGAQVAIASVPLLRDRLERLVLISPTPKFCASDDFPHGLPPSHPAGLALKLKRRYPEALAGFFHSMFDHRGGNTDEASAAERVLQGAPLPDRDSLLLALDTLAGSDLREAVPLLDIPTLIVHGTLDRICPPGASEWLARNIPDCRLEMIAETGHAPFIEKPDVFNCIIEGFLEEVRR